MLSAELRGKALVTGGGRGIGANIARELALAGRYLHAEHDPPEKLRERVDAILADDLNAVRLRR
jgi:NAD(P)-dependent dehydrogenase (short-subunit alcohol dehydrogenase family)